MKTALIVMMQLFAIAALAQTSVSGSVADKLSGRPVEFASVFLIQLPDSSSTGTVTDKKGKFIIDNVQPGTYLLRCSFIGFGNVESAVFTISPSQAKYNHPTIELVNDTKSLSDVTVVGKRAALNTSIDRKVYNVEQDIMSRAGSASDILRNVPSVEVDIDGNVNLRGSGDVMILINGKPSPLMGRSRAEVLQQLPANSIERIEIITNPSARYRPDGTSGIINIVLKKNIRNGFNGSVTANAGNRNRYNGNMSLNYKPGKFNLFGSYSSRIDTRRRFSNIDLAYLDISTQDVTRYFKQTGYSFSRPRSNIINLGVDYNINDRNSLGASGTYFMRRVARNNVLGYFNYDDHFVFTDQYERTLNGPEKENQGNGLLYFEHKFKKEDHSLRFEYNTSDEKEVADNGFVNRYVIPAKPFTLDNTRISERVKENQLTIDYSNPLSETSKLELGYDGLYNQVDLDFYGEFYDTSQSRFVKDTEKSNRFIYDEDIHALYATYQKSFEKFSFSAGTRAEAVYTRSHLLPTDAFPGSVDSFVYNDYFNIYPTIHLSYNLKDNHELQLNYSKRVNRPEGDELNPFPEFQDPRNLSSGNPKLLPEIIHSVEFGYKWQGKNVSFVPSIYYRYTKNGFTSVVVALNDSTLLTTEQNLSNSRSAGLELILSVKNSKWFSTNLSTNIFYNRINADNLGYIQNRSVVSMSANLNSNFTITKTTMLQVSGNYRSARLTPQGKFYPVVVFNTGLRQDLLRNKVSITFTASDIFKSQRQRSTINTPYLLQESVNRRDGQIFYVGVSYRFGIMKKAKELEFDEGQ